MKSIRLLCAAVLAASGLVTAGAITESASAATSKELSTAYTTIIKGEKFQLAGRVNAARTVKLQYRSKTTDPWTTKTTGVTSAADGYFAFSNLSTTKTRYYRYYAPATKSYSKILSYSKKMTAVSQSVKIFDISNARQCHPLIGPVQPFEVMTVFVKFYPARANRAVTLLSEKYGTQNSTQDSRGIATFTMDPGLTKQSSVNRVYTAAANGAPAKYTTSITTIMSTCVFKAI